MTESRSDLALAASLRLLTPLIAMLLREGITYPHFAQALKQVFLEAAVGNIEARGGRSNDSNLSVLSGVHRKDVREWRKAGRPLPPARNLSAAMQVFTRWVSDPAYCDKKGKPLLLERGGSAGSFEELAASVSTDVHPRAVLEELLRLGVVESVSRGGKDGASKLHLCSEAFVPAEGYAEMLQLFADNVGDHIAAASHNLGGEGEPMLEQSVFADGLSPQSADILGVLARKVWARAFSEMVREATRLSQQDEGQPDADRRVRLGMYYYQDSKSSDNT